MKTRSGRNDGESWEKREVREVRGRSSTGEVPGGSALGASRGVVPQVLKYTSRPHGEKHRGCTSLRRAFLGSGGSVPERGCQTQAMTGGNAQAGSV